MSPPWLYAPELRVGLSALPPDEARHARQVLRCRPGDAVVLFDGRGNWGAGVVVESPEDSTAKVSPRKRRDAQCAARVTAVYHTPPPRCRLTLITAACKGPRLDYLVEKATELGVDRLLVATFERSVVRLDFEHADRLLATALAACKQAGRARLPEVRTGLSLHEAVEAARSSRLLVADPSNESIPAARLLDETQAAGGDAAAIIGPEGGISPTERVWLDELGATRAWLGRFILRVETAAVAVAACWAASSVPLESSSESRPGAS
ncbi:MAG: 16S rRNA (uracil(1498)-N(3))-methyltransferase [Phycisphaerales bacterium]|nr:16S rRNA (uracil(1498)-N(3))-methyltransferase [Phycisphaerales bacterium]